MSDLDGNPDCWCSHAKAKISTSSTTVALLLLMPYILQATSAFVLVIQIAQCLSYIHTFKSLTFLLHSAISLLLS